MRNVTVDYKFAITAAWDAVHNNYIQKSQECIYACLGHLVGAGPIASSNEIDAA